MQPAKEVCIERTKSIRMETPGFFVGTPLRTTELDKLQIIFYITIGLEQNFSPIFAHMFEDHLKCTA